MFRRQRQSMSRIEVWKEYEFNYGHGHSAKHKMLELYLEHVLLCLTNVNVITQEQMYKSMQVWRAEKDMKTKLQGKPEHPFDSAAKYILCVKHLSLDGDFHFSNQWLYLDDTNEWDEPNYLTKNRYFSFLSKRSIGPQEKETIQISIIWGRRSK
jgi:hypothetical protein